MWRWIMALVLFTVCLPAFADSVWMNDGTVRKGIVLDKNDDEVLLSVDREGIKATIGLPAKNVLKIVKSQAAATGPATHETTAAATTQIATPSPKPPIPPQPPPEQKITRGSVASTEFPPTGGFLIELAAAATGSGPDDPRRLPEDLRELWDHALRMEAQKKPIELLGALRALDDAFLPIDGGKDRLDAICLRERNETFGVWFARVHWELVSTHFAGGKFDLGEIREAERKPLLGILKEKTAPALEPLKPYFPPVDPKTGKAEPFKPTQLQGITAANALEVKNHASFASAVLLAQLKLEPDMPAIDKLYIGNQISTVRRILSRAMDLEPAARAAAEKAATQHR